MMEIETEPSREYWIEYELRKARIQNIGLKSGEYDREIKKIVADLDAQFGEEPEDNYP